MSYGSVNDMPTSYVEAQRRLGNRSERQIANNTRLIQRSDGIALRLHSTDIVGFFPDGRILLRSGGWESVTTKQRLNAVASSNGYYISQRDYRWTVYRTVSHEKVAEWYGSFTIPAPESDKPFDVLAFVMDFESGDLDDDSIIEGFQHLIDSGTVWGLQGTYGRTAHALIEGGYCTPAPRVVVDGA